MKTSHICLVLLANWCLATLAIAAVTRGKISSISITGIPLSLSLSLALKSSSNNLPLFSIRT